MSDNFFNQKLDHKVMGDIAETGWSVIGVVDADPPFTYTVGFSRLNEPELFMTGRLSIEIMAAIINDVGELPAERRVDGAVLDDVLANGYKLALRKVDPTAAEMNVCSRYFNDVTALQLVWPDQEGALPWEEDYMYGPEVQPLP